MRVVAAFAAIAAIGCGSLPGSGDDGTAPDAGDGDAPPFSQMGGPYFSTPMFFNRDISGVAKATYTDATIAALRAAGGWGNGDVFQIDFSIEVLSADASTPKRTFTKTGDFFSPDCDDVAVPVPSGGNVEGETGYACTHNGDCHLLVYDHDG